MNRLFPFLILLASVFGLNAASPALTDFRGTNEVLVITNPTTHKVVIGPATPISTIATNAANALNLWTNENDSIKNLGATSIQAVDTNAFLKIGGGGIGPVGIPVDPTVFIPYWSFGSSNLGYQYSESGFGLYSGDPYIGLFQDFTGVRFFASDQDFVVPLSEVRVESRELGLSSYVSINSEQSAFTGNEVARVILQPHSGKAITLRAANIGSYIHLGSVFTVDDDGLVTSQFGFVLTDTFTDYFNAGFNKTTNATPFDSAGIISGYAGFQDKAASSIPTNTASVKTIAPANLHNVALGKGWTNDLGARADLVLSVKYTDSATGDPAFSFTNSITGEAWTNSIAFGLASTVQLTVVIPDLSPNDRGSFTDLSGAGASLTILKAWWKLK